jgi:RNA polymerase primary sigma factor
MAKSVTVAKSNLGTDVQDRPLLDTHNATLKKLVARGKEQGYITYEELNVVLPQEQVSSDQIEVVLTTLSEMGINLIDGEESEDNEDVGARKGEKAVVEKEANEKYERTEDPIRMYLREMGSVKLLSREGEIAIAKRNEAGRETMINGICQSPLTIRAIIEWRDMLVNGEVLLREIIDLGATYVGNREGNGADKSEAQNADAKTLKAEAEKPGDEEDDEEESNVSLVAMEMALKPIVLETCDLIAKTYKSFHKVQDARMQAAMKHQELTPRQEKRYQKLRGELVALVQRVHLHNNRT